MGPASAEAAEALIATATLAPSSHNTQPWRFSCDGAVIELRADRRRALPVNDPFDRELVVSCGAALFNLRVAAEAAGWPASVTVGPARDDDDLLARVVLGAGHPRGHAELVGALARRRTHRGAFVARSVPPDVRGRLETAAREHGLAVRWVPPGDERQRLAELVGDAARDQFHDAAWRRELAAWMRPRRSGDGLTVAAFAVPAVRFVVSRFDVGARTARREAVATRVAPLVGVLATGRDDAADWLTAGQALEHVLLVAAADGVLAGYLNQPCQVTRLRPQLRLLLDLDGHPQVVLRLGFPSDMPTAAPPRRPVHEVVDHRRDSDLVAPRPQG